jgi:hypothetical protein
MIPSAVASSFNYVHKADKLSHRIHYSSHTIPHHTQLERVSNALRVADPMIPSAVASSSSAVYDFSTHMANSVGNGNFSAPSLSSLSHQLSSRDAVSLRALARDFSSESSNHRLSSSRLHVTAARGGFMSRSDSGASSKRVSMSSLGGFGSPKAPPVTLLRPVSVPQRDKNSVVHGDGDVTFVGMEHAHDRTWVVRVLL